MTGGGGAVATREVGPAGARPEHPENAIDGAAVIGARTAPTVSRRQERGEDGPLGVGQIGRRGSGHGGESSSPYYGLYLLGITG